MVENLTAISQRLYLKNQRIKIKRHLYCASNKRHDHTKNTDSISTEIHSMPGHGKPIIGRHASCEIQ